MKFIILFIIFFLHAFAFAEQNTFERFFNNLSTLEAEFIQKNYNTNDQLITEARGKVYLKRPNQLYWHTHQPNEQIMVASGSFFWFYDVDLEQASKRHIDHIRTSPLYWLIAKNAKKDAQLIGQNDTTQWYQTTHQNAPFDRIKFAFTNKQLSALELHNIHGKLIIDLIAVHINQPIDDSLFIFNAPAGVDVIE